MSCAEVRLRRLDFILEDLLYVLEAGQNRLYRDVLLRGTLAAPYMLL